MEIYVIIITAHKCSVFGRSVNFKIVQNWLIDFTSDKCCFMQIFEAFAHSFVCVKLICAGILEKKSDQNRFRQDLRL